MSHSAVEVFYVNEFGEHRCDSYGHFVTTSERHPLCRCRVPCQGRFRCRDRHHEGDRSVPYCVGCDDGEIDHCDDCWARRHRGEAAAE